MPLHGNGPLHVLNAPPQKTSQVRSYWQLVIWSASALLGAQQCRKGGTAQPCEKIFALGDLGGHMFSGFRGSAQVGVKVSSPQVDGGGATGGVRVSRKCSQTGDLVTLRE